MIDGLLLIDKDRGVSSNEVVMYFKKKYRQGKVGHGGTLDPLATGLLMILLGSATRFFPQVIASEKEYLFTVQFGRATTTFDSEGSVTHSSDNRACLPDITKLLPQFLGDIEQIPPMYSAKKVQGEPLYKLARRGIEIEREPKKVKIYSLDLISFNPDDQTLVLKAVVGRGTYIRVLAHDLGLRLGVYGFCSDIRRTRIGSHRTEQAVKFSAVKETGLEPEAISPGWILPHLEKVDITAGQWQTVKNGGSVRTGQVAAVPRTVRVFEANQFKGLGTLEFGSLKPLRIIGDNE